MFDSPFFFFLYCMTGFPSFRGENVTCGRGKKGHLQLGAVVVSVEAWVSFLLCLRLCFLMMFQG